MAATRRSTRALVRALLLLLVASAAQALVIERCGTRARVDLSLLRGVPTTVCWSMKISTDAATSRTARAIVALTLSMNDCVVCVYLSSQPIVRDPHTCVRRRRSLSSSSAVLDEMIELFVVQHDGRLKNGRLNHVCTVRMQLGRVHEPHSARRRHDPPLRRRRRCVY